MEGETGSQKRSLRSAEESLALNNITHIIFVIIIFLLKFIFFKFMIYNLKHSEKNQWMQIFLFLMIISTVFIKKKKLKAQIEQWAHAAVIK